MRAAWLGLLLLAAGLPLAAANQVEAAHWAFRDTAFTPQLGCLFVFDTGGSERCEDFNDLSLAQTLTVRIQGSASVFAFVDDLKTGSARQLAVASCATSCERSFGGLTSTPTARLHVDATGSPKAIVSVTVESQIERVLIETGLDALLP